MSVLRFLSKDIINSFGYEIRRVPHPSDIAAEPIQSGDPITYQYMPRLRGSAVFEIAVEDARGLNCLGLQFRPESHPFVRAALAARDSVSETVSPAIVHEVLSEYYRQVCPSSALEAVDLTTTEAPGLKNVRAAGWLLPWADKTVAETMRGREIAMRLDALQYGKMLPYSEGITAFGPVGTRKLALEVARLHHLITSIAENGFDPVNRKNPMKVVGLRKNESYRWLVAAGHHRFAVCAAFFIRLVPAMVVDIVRREDCEHWPQVVAGNFTPEGAGALFDRLYDGVPPPVCAGWTGAGVCAAVRTPEPAEQE